MRCGVRHGNMYRLNTAFYQTYLVLNCYQYFASHFFKLSTDIKDNFNHKRRVCRAVVRIGFFHGPRTYFLLSETGKRHCSYFVHVYAWTDCMLDLLHYTLKRNTLNINSGKYATCFAGYVKRRNRKEAMKLKQNSLGWIWLKYLFYGLTFVP